MLFVFEILENSMGSSSSFRTSSRLQSEHEQGRSSSLCSMLASLWIGENCLCSSLSKPRSRDGTSLCFAMSGKFPNIWRGISESSRNEFSGIYSAINFSSVAHLSELWGLWSIIPRSWRVFCYRIKISLKSSSLFEVNLEVFISFICCSKTS